MNLSELYYKSKSSDYFSISLINSIFERMRQNSDSFKAVENASKIPWPIIAILHQMESGMDFSTHLHNGDPLTQRTVRVPAGRPRTGQAPFGWSESAIDALSDRPRIDFGDLDAVLEWLEAYNGFGYRNKGINSPYLWSGTDAYDKGKYVEDGIYNPNARSQQVGAVVFLKMFERARLINFAEEITLKEATWFEFYRAQTPTVIAWAGSEPLYRLETKSIDDLVEFFATHRQAKTFAVAPAEKKIPLPKPIEPEPEIDATCTLTRYKEAVTMPVPWRSAGLKPLCLKVGTEEFLVVSGQGYAQNFRKPENTLSYPGNMEPIPQGDYEIGQIEFAGGKDNYSASWGPGLGPVWVALTAMFKDDRSAFGFHLDMNIVTSPGSAGCVVFSSVADLRSFVTALRKHDPKKLSVNWNL